MRLVKSHRERAENIREFIGKNKLFTVLAVIILLWLLGTFLFSTANQNESGTTANAAAQSETAEDKSEWRFYPIDGLILLVGGGFCTVMIIRERKRAKEELQ